MTASSDLWSQTAINIFWNIFLVIIPTSLRTPPNIICNLSCYLGNATCREKGFEEVYYFKRISKGFIFRSYPGPWQALLEKPDSSVEILKEYKTKPSLREVSELVRDVSFKRYAINNDRWMSGRM